MAETFKILIMGGEQTGKTTLLASIVDQLRHGPISNIITMSDKNPKATKRLESKISELRWLMTAYQGLTILVNDENTTDSEDYTVELKMPDSREVIKIVFSIASDKFYESGTLASDRMKKKILSFDAYIIAVDTPYLMEASNTMNKLCTESVNEGVNVVNAIRAFLNLINDSERNNLCQVMFVPLKCEYWANRGELETVYRQVINIYRTALLGLMENRAVEVVVIPIQTAGGLVFQEQRKSYLLYGNSRDPQRCAVIEEERKIRLENGVVFAFCEREMIHEDPTVIFSKENSQFRPLSWFNVTGHYESRNCEQVILYFLRFLVSKLLAKRIFVVENTKLSVWEITACILSGSVNPYLPVGYLGSKYCMKKKNERSIIHLRNLLETLTDRKWFKVNSEGIHIVG